MQKQYKLLTPGPLTTTDTVKQVMLFDHCTWDDDYKADHPVDPPPSCWS